MKIALEFADTLTCFDHVSVYQCDVKKIVTVAYHEALFDKAFQSYKVTKDDTDLTNAYSSAQMVYDITGNNELLSALPPMPVRYYTDSPF